MQSRVYKALARIRAAKGEVRIIRRYKADRTDLEDVSAEVVELCFKRGWLRQICKGSGLELYKLTKAAPGK